MEKLDQFTTAYLEAALWASDDQTNPESSGEPLDSNYGIHDIEAKTLAEMVIHCKEFQQANADFIRDDNVAVESPESMAAAYGCDARAGHDFWLTRNGHGCGFWDGDWREPAATTLSDAAIACGEYNISAPGKGIGQVERM